MYHSLLGVLALIKVYPFEFFLIDWRNVLWLGLKKSSGQKSVSMFSNPLSFSAENIETDFCPLNFLNPSQSMFRQSSIIDV